MKICKNNGLSETVLTLLFRFVYNRVLVYNYCGVLTSKHTQDTQVASSKKKLICRGDVISGTP